VGLVPTPDFVPLQNGSPTDRSCTLFSWSPAFLHEKENHEVESVKNLLGWTASTPFPACHDMITVKMLLYCFYETWT
jgi:hypothetical protein